MILGLAGCGGEPEVPRARLKVVESLGAGGGDLEGYARATEVRPFTFPADHGPHSDFRTEWWYFTGNLEGEVGRRFGYQLTFFRTAVAPPGEVDAGALDTAAVDAAAVVAAEDAVPGSGWRTRQVWMAHLAVTDSAGRRFSAFERFARGAAGLAGAEAEPFRVWTGPWSAATVDGAVQDGEEGGSTFPLRLRASAEGDAGEVGLDLVLETGDGWVAQGDRGLSQKGEGEGNASYYYSFPHMPTVGNLTVDGERFAVSGTSWLDREWSTSLLAPGQVGWDWFSLQLDDGSEVIAFRLREAEDPLTAEAAPLGYAALGPSDAGGGGASGGPLPLRLLDAGAAELTVTGRWNSPASGITWPSGWRLVLPEAGLDLALEPILAGQELDVSFRYWEGAIEVRGTRDGRPITGRGYAELTGYGEAQPAAEP